MFPSTESDALKYENADRVGEKEKRKRRWENVRKDLNIIQESNFAIFADFFKSSTPKYDNVDQLLRTWCDASVNPTNRRNERNGFNTRLNDARDKQARSTGREMEGMVPNHDVNITRDHEYYKYSPSDDGVLLALSDRDRGVHRSYSLRKERELDVPEMNGSETTRPSYATSSLARKSDELCYLHAPVVTRSIPTVDVVAELNRKTLDIFKSQLEATRRAQDFTAREVYINESVQRVMTHVLVTHGKIESRGDSHEWAAWTDEMFFRKMFEIFPKDRLPCISDGFITASNRLGEIRLTLDFHAVIPEMQYVQTIRDILDETRIEESISVKQNAQLITIWSKISGSIWRTAPKAKYSGCCILT